MPIPTQAVDLPVFPEPAVPITPNALTDQQVVQAINDVEKYLEVVAAKPEVQADPDVAAAVSGCVTAAHLIRNAIAANAQP